MCGICGKWNRAGADVEALRRMSAVIEHRGPDDSGEYVDGPMALGIRRLSIIDVAGGHQPIMNEDRTLSIVFNGEIYNHPVLRNELEAHGHKFRTRSDTEVVLHLFEQFGVECVRKLRGMFAFAIWDSVRQRLYMARDHFGQKHLYYRKTADSFAFASEMKALLTDAYSPAVSHRAVSHLLSIRCVPGDETLFSGIRKLPAAHWLLFDSGLVTVGRYWDLSYADKLPGSEPEIVSAVGGHVRAAVRSHMLSDVRVGSFLSGGIDSSLVTAHMAENVSGAVPTFALGVSEDDFNELPFARMVADRYRTEHHEMTIQPDLVSALPEMLWHMEEPVDPFAFGIWSVAKLASQHVKVVLCGDGGDEIFAGYDRYLGNSLVDVYCMVPRAIRSAVIEPMIRALPDNFSYNNRVQKLRWMVAMSRTGSGTRYAESAAFLRFSHEQKEQLFTDSLWREVGNDSSTDLLQAYFEAPNAVESLDRMLYTDVRTRLAEHILMVGDRMSMAHGLEARSPYLDVELAEFVARIPSAMKISGRRLKHLLRESARGFLPDALVDRPKRGLSFPLAYWFRGPLRGVASELFATSRIADAGLFRREFMQGLLGAHANGSADHNYRLWLLVNLELWFRMFIEGVSQPALGELLRDSWRRNTPAAATGAIARR